MKPLISADEAGSSASVAILQKIYHNAQHDLFENISLYRQQLGEIGDTASQNSIDRLINLFAEDRTGTVPLAFIASFRQSIWEKLHAVHWRYTPVVYRALFGTLSVMLVSLCFISRPGHEIKQLIFTADMGLLLGSSDSAEALNEIVSTLSKVEAREMLHPAPPRSFSRESADGKRPLRSFPILRHDAMHKGTVPIVTKPDMLEFYEQYFVPQVPVILTDCIDDWPALCSPETNWQDIDYIKQGANLPTMF